MDESDDEADVAMDEGDLEVDSADADIEYGPDFRIDDDGDETDEENAGAQDISPEDEVEVIDEDIVADEEGDDGAAVDEDEDENSSNHEMDSDVSMDLMG